MAKIKLGAIVVDMSGKLGGHVFAKNKGGNYMRTKTTPSNPQTIYQNTVRAIFALISAKWGNLTESARESWRTAVSSFANTNVFGDLKNPTGKALFQRLNQNLELSNQAQLDNAPQPQEIAQTNVDGVDLNIEVSGTEISVIVDFPADNPECTAMLYMTPKLSEGTKFVKNKLRFIEAKLIGTDDSAVNINATKIIERFGFPSVGDKHYVGVRFVNAVGQVTPMQTAVAKFVQLVL